MIDFYYWPKPNGWKIAILLEELALPYRTIPVNIGRGEQFAPQFLAISPNNRMPAIVDHDVDGDPVPVFESGAIAMYLVNKTGKLLPPGQRAWKEAQERPAVQRGVDLGKAYRRAAPPDDAERKMLFGQRAR